MCIEPYYMADTSLGTRDRMVRNTGHVFLHLRIAQWLPIVLRLKACCQGLQGPTWPCYHPFSSMISYFFFVACSSLTSFLVFFFSVWLFHLWLFLSLSPDCLFPELVHREVFSQATYELSSHYALTDVSGKDVQVWGSSPRDVPEIQDTSKSWMGWGYEEIFESNSMTFLSISVCRNLGKWPEPIKLRFYCVQWKNKIQKSGEIQEEFLPYTDDKSRG